MLPRFALRDFRILTSKPFGKGYKFYQSSMCDFLNYCSQKPSLRGGTDFIAPPKIQHKYFVYFNFLGAFAKLRKATVSFMSVCRSVRLGQLGSEQTEVYEI
jgi:hypothetical protein